MCKITGTTDDEMTQNQSRLSIYSFILDSEIPYCLYRHIYIRFNIGLKLYNFSCVYKNYNNLSNYYYTWTCSNTILLIKIAISLWRWFYFFVSQRPFESNIYFGFVLDMS